MFATVLSLPLPTAQLNDMSVACLFDCLIRIPSNVTGTLACLVDVPVPAVLLNSTYVVVVSEIIISLQRSTGLSLPAADDLASCFT